MMVLVEDRAALQKTPRKSQESRVEIVSTESSDSGCENTVALLHSNVLWVSVVFSASATPPSVIGTTLSALALANHIQKCVREGRIGGGLRKSLRTPKHFW